MYILTAKVNRDAVTGSNISFLAGKEIILCHYLKRRKTIP